MKENTNNHACCNDSKRIVSTHPCYSFQAQHKYGRIHLPVAPACNISCNFCDRKFDCVNESRPGVTSKVLTPLEALEKTKEALSKHPYIKVAGICGPGDPLANKNTFETFELIKSNFDDLLLCLSTNGLNLPDYLEEINRLQFKTITVTVNAIEPGIQEKIIDSIQFKNRTYRGLEASEILINNQLEGIAKAIESGIHVKVNSVLIPGINDTHIVEIAKKMNELGAYILNVMPLISQAKFSHIDPPTHQERKLIQHLCKPYIKLMRHCRQCRADDVGLLINESRIVSDIPYQ